MAMEEDTLNETNPLEGTTFNESEAMEEDEVSSTIPIRTQTGLKLSALNPKYLHTNSTSHTWPFSAIAELVDNAYDPDVKASKLCIDLHMFNGSKLALVFNDNGNGMTPEKLYKMVSFGFCEKVAVKGHMPVGHYGNGFKSGSMRLGRDALVLTKCETSRSIAFLSQTYLEAIKADTVIVPLISWDKNSEKISEETAETHSLPAILKHSVLNSLTAIEEEFTKITSPTGTRIIISNLRKGKDPLTEFDIMTNKHDILIPDDDVNSAEGRYKREERQDHIPLSDYSLRAYLAILYLKPKMQIYLCGKKVKTMVIQKSLSKTEIDTYQPKGQKQVKIVFGFSLNINHYGIMMYHRNRLIKPYVRVGCQLKANNIGVGVVGVIECTWLQPTHNKQDFDYTQLYRSTMAALGMKLLDYWNEKCYEMSNSGSIATAGELADENWVQCERTDCLKWRKLPDHIKPDDLAEKWFCCMHPNPDWAKCSVPEEPEDSDDQVRPYQKLFKRQCTTTNQQQKQQREQREREQREQREQEQREQQQREQHEKQVREQQRQINREAAALTAIVNSTKQRPHPPELPAAPVQIMSPTGPRRMEPLTENQRKTLANALQPIQNTVPQVACVHPSVRSSDNLPQIARVTSLGQPSAVNTTPSSAQVLSPLNSPQSSSTSSIIKKEAPTSSAGAGADKKRPITIDDSDDEDSPTPAKLKRDSVLPSVTIRNKTFEITKDKLKGIDEDIIADLKTQNIQTLGVSLAHRSQRLRNLKNKMYYCMRSMFPEPTDLDYEREVPDEALEDKLQRLIAAAEDTNDANPNG